MPDISMCPAADCSVSPRCRRHEASGTIPTPGWQTYSTFGPIGPDCDGFRPIREPPDAALATPGTPTAGLTAGTLTPVKRTTTKGG